MYNKDNLNYKKYLAGMISENDYYDSIEADTAKNQSDKSYFQGDESSEKSNPLDDAKVKPQTQKYLGMLVDHMRTMPKVAALELIGQFTKEVIQQTSGSGMTLNVIKAKIAEVLDELEEE